VGNNLNIANLHINIIIHGLTLHQTCVLHSAVVSKPKTLSGIDIILQQTIHNTYIIF